MLCRLGLFEFKSADVNIESANDSWTFAYEQSQTINSFDEWQAVGKHSRNRELSGLLIQKKSRALDPLIAMAAAKKPVTLSFESGFAHSVIITAINTTESYFLSNGVALKRDFSVTLEFVYG